MFKKIKDLLPKGKRFMELPSSERNKKTIKEGSDAMVDEMREFMGADGIVLYAVRNNTSEKGETGTSVFKFYKNVDAIDVLPLYEDLQEKIADSFSPSTLESLRAVQKIKETPSGGGVSSEIVAESLRVALDGIPEDIAVQIMQNIKKDIAKKAGVEIDDVAPRKKSPKKKDGGEFDDIIGKL